MRKLLLFFVLPFLLAACGQEDKAIHGYVEGEFVLVSPTSDGVLQSLAVERGQKVQAGDALFSLDLTELAAQRDAARAEVERARAELEDLLKGERPEEIAIILKQKAQAHAELVNARKEYERILPLTKLGATSRSSLGEARARYDAAKARQEEVEAQLKAANLGARIDRIAAAEAAVESAAQALVQAEKKLADAAPLASVGATVEDTFFRPGEYVAAGKPVVSLLPPGNVKIRFFVPQAVVPALRHGQPVTVACDGCAEPMTAKITYISPDAEYTPPVIFSVESRDKLVFIIEAEPDAFHPELRPGLPVDVTVGQP